MIFRMTDCPTPVLVGMKLLEDNHDHHFAYSAYRAAENLRRRKLRSLGWMPKRYLVGCSKCDVCAEEKNQRKCAKWFTRIHALLAILGNGRSYKRSVMGEDIEIKGERAFFVTVTVSDLDYPGLSYRPTESELAEMVKSEGYQRWVCLAFRHRLQTIFKWLRHRDHKFRYLIVFEFGNHATRRIHAHMFVFTETVSEFHEFATDFRLEWNWRHKTSFDQGVRWRAVDSESAGAAYASKYSMKCQQYFRLMVSQFNFDNLLAIKNAIDYNVTVEEFYECSPAGYESIAYKGGFTKWRIVKEGRELSFSNDLPVTAMLENYVKLSSVVADVEFDEPTLRPFEGGYLKWQWMEDYDLMQMSNAYQELGPGCRLRMVPILPVDQLQNRLHTSPGLRWLRRKKGAHFVCSCVEVIGLEQLCRVLEARLSF